MNSPETLCQNLIKSNAQQRQRKTNLATHAYKHHILQHFPLIYNCSLSADMKTTVKGNTTDKRTIILPHVMRHLGSLTGSHLLQQKENSVLTGISRFTNTACLPNTQLTVISRMFPNAV
jgi:hypothetical protein